MYKYNGVMISYMYVGTYGNTSLESIASIYQKAGMPKKLHSLEAIKLFS
jgi:hypothetical protein